MQHQQSRAQLAITVLAGAASLLAIAGCSGSSDNSNSTAASTAGYTAAQYRQALTRDYGHFKWPNDYQPVMSELAKQTFPSSNLQVPNGYQDLILGLVSECAWDLSWNHASETGNNSAATKALQVLRNDVPNYPAQDAGGRQFAVAAAQKAALGDGSQVLQFAKSNCSQTVWKKH